MNKGHRYIVRYKGFLQKVERSFETYERALQWVRQAGKEKEAIITKETA
jgi:hypothetical protein